MDVNKNVQNTQIAYNMRQFLKFLRILNIFTQKLVTAKVNENDSAALSHHKLGRPSRKISITMFYRDVTVQRMDVHIDICL